MDRWLVESVGSTAALNQPSCAIFETAKVEEEGMRIFVLSPREIESRV